ncbi:hypothetical protein FRC04_004064 [Tulasnella sp. 424]|nr:hypothetical protein FRC04_004064 [Tulasnella sp. 424]KAG8964495.1 hypothetical protein FRC05_003776 [Tulasnella sp. 425]
MSADCKLHGPSFLGLNSVSSHEEWDIIFTGGSAVEAEGFIFAIKWQAFSKGKHKDNTWAAEYASIRFARKALRCYEKLDVETQNDWNLLKRAILDEYAEDQLPSSMVPTSVPIPPSSVPNVIAPAASPIRTGRIRVESECSDIRGYITSTFFGTNWCMVDPNQCAAAIFDFDASARTIKYNVGADNLRSNNPALTSSITGHFR